MGLIQKNKRELVRNIFRKTRAFFLTYKGIRIGFIFIFLILFYNSLNIIEFAGEKEKHFFLKSKSDYEDYYNASINLRNKRDMYYSEKIIDFQEEILNKDIRIDQMLSILSNLKGVGTYLYPPFFAFLLIPLSYFDYNLSAFFYQIFQIGFLILTLYLLYKMGKLFQLSRRRILYFILISLFLYLPFHIQNFSNGNVGEILILLMSLSMFFYFYKKNLIYNFLNGIILGFAIMIKVLPGFLLGYYFVRRKFTILLSSIIGTGISFVLPASVLGWGTNLDFFIKWIDMIIKNFQKYVAIRPYANNQTISAMIAKFFLPFADLKQSFYGLPIIDAISYVAVIQIIKIFNFLLLVFFIIFTLYFFIKNFNKNIQDSVGIYYLYMSLLVALLTSGISWYHSYVLLFPITTLIYFLDKSNINKNIFIISPVYMWIHSLLPFYIKDFLSLYSVFTIVNLYIFIILYYKLFLIIRNQK